MTSLGEKLRRRLVGLPRTPRELDAALRLLSSLRRTGWFRNLGSMPVDPFGEPVPWWPYAAIHVVDHALPSDGAVLEWGSGASSLWLAARVATVRAVEHDATWAASLASRAPKNLHVVAVTGTGIDDYLTAAGDGPFDLVVVDGIHRAETLDRAAAVVSVAELILLDDSDRPEYQPAVERLCARGYRCLELTGLRPSGGGPGIATLFFRESRSVGW